MSWQVVRRSIWIGVGLAVLYTLLYSPIGQVFTADLEVQRLFTAVFWMVIITQPLNAVAFAFDGIFKGLGEGALLRNVLILATALVFVPVILIGHQLGGLLFAVWSAFLAWMAARSMALAVSFQRRYRPATGGRRR